jgi:hypothetical protein
LATDFFTVLAEDFLVDDFPVLSREPVAALSPLAMDFFAGCHTDAGICCAIRFAFAPATPPTTAPTAAPIGPTIDPAAAPAAAPPTMPKPDVELEFVPDFLTFAMQVSSAE